ncbi:MAG: large subunit ribosomal protein [Patescibacteria group bacterium]|nr:large subunit ribosomal protein [Patescibacteria group bacterium]
MKSKNPKTEKRARIKRKIRAKVSGTSSRPRLSVYKSNKNIYAQLIDDVSGKTIFSASDVKDKKGTKKERAALVGKNIAQGALGMKVSEIVFDRNGFNYTGRIKLLADSAREAGLKF